MHEWFVAGALIEDRDRLLLVQNQRRNGAHDWTPPGGVVEVHEGESVIDGLAREVTEEVGLEVLAWSSLLYRVEAHAPDLNWRMRAEIYAATTVTGELAVGNDPDGIVTSAEWVTHGDCAGYLETAHTWVREPLVEWLGSRWDEPRDFSYRLDGATLGEGRIVRL